METQIVVKVFFSIIYGTVLMKHHIYKMGPITSSSEWKKNNLTRCGAPNSLKMAPNCVASGVVQTNEYVGARVGAGYIDSELNGSESTTYWTRSVSNSSGSFIFTIIFVRVLFYHFSFSLNHKIILLRF